MAVAQRKTRAKKVEDGGQRVIKQKFMEEREESVKTKPLVPMNKKQQEYMRLLEEKSVVVATGFPGTSKTYLPTCMAADLYKTGKINKIVITRPAVSSSKSLGYFSGDSQAKMEVWLNAVIPIFHERLGRAAYDIALACGDISYQPMETIKGSSFNDAWLLVEESSDLTKDEVVKLVTRMGRNSKLVLSGDIRQSEINKGAGLAWMADFVQRHNLGENYGFVDFNDVNDIVRSDAVRQFIVCMVRDEKHG